MDPFPEYERYDAVGLGDLVRAEEVHPRELVEAAVARVEERNPAINAVVYTAFDQAREAADAGAPGGAFPGVPFLIKDLGAAYAGLPYTQSSRSRRGHVPAADNEIVRRFKAAGLVIVGKTSTPEFGLAPVTEPELHGPCRNPWDLSRTPCGSSGGAASAVAAGIVPMAHGNDGGGSIRMPASACGLFGLKPSRGRSTWGPDYIESWMGLSEQHGITRTVRDSARLLDAVQGADPGATSVAPPPGRPFGEEVGADPGRLRIAFTTGPLLDTEPLDPDCVRAVEDVATLCGELGHDVDEAAPPIDVEEVLDAFITLAGAEAAFQIAESERISGRRVRSGDVELITWIVGLIGTTRSAGDLMSAYDVMRRVGRIMAGFLTGYDVLLSCTMARPPWPIGELELSGKDRATLQVVKRVPATPLMNTVVRQMSGEILRPMPNTPLFNLTGQPAMSVPLVWNSGGLPIGTQFAGRLYEEAILFRLAGQLEEARPWFDRRPGGWAGERPDDEMAV